MVAPGCSTIPFLGEVDWMRSPERSDRLHWCHAGSKSTVRIRPGHSQSLVRLIINQRRPSSESSPVQRSRSQWSRNWATESMRRSKRLRNHSRLGSFEKPFTFRPYPFFALSHPLVPVPTDIAWCSRPRCRRPRIFATIICNHLQMHEEGRHSVKIIL